MKVTRAIAKALEECGELIDVIGKILVGRKGVGKKRFVEEASDVYAAMQVLDDHGLIDHDRVKEKLRKWK